MLDISSVYQSFPGRRKQIQLLEQIYDVPGESLPAAVFIHGHSAVGKTSIVRAFVKAIIARVAYVNCIECYTHRLLFEPILSQLLGSTWSGKCDNLLEVIFQLKIARKTEIFKNDAFIIVLDGVEYLDEINDLYLSSFCKLQELSGMPNLSVICMSTVLPEKFNLDCSFITIHFPQYSKDEIMTIFKTFKPKDCEEKFYENYLNSVLLVVSRTTRDLNELRNLIVNNFDKYYEPVKKGQVEESDSMALWKLAIPQMKLAQYSAYLGASSNDDTTEFRTLPFDLPFYAKYILVAAYLASYNSPRHDRQLFLKHSTKRKKTVQRQHKTEKISNELLGPKAFPLDRLLAIVFSIMDEKASLTVNLLSQIASLVELRLMVQLGVGNLTKPKYKCLAGFQCVEMVSRNLGFDLKKYLMD